LAENQNCAAGTPSAAPAPNPPMLTTGMTALTVGSVSAMKTGLNQQPVAVSIEADKFSFQSYKSGIFDKANCGTTLDHAVLLVGYGTDNGQEYWLMKNSWGTGWGDKGYMQMAIVGDGDGICGVQMEPVIPLI